MNKQNLIDLVSADTGYTKVSVQRVIDSVKMDLSKINYILLANIFCICYNSSKVRYVA